MKTNSFKMLACWAVLGSALAVPVFAQPGPGAGMGPGNGPGWSLMSPAEREAHWTALRSAQSLDECKAVQAQQHAQLEARAKERGITLPAAPQNVCERIMAGGRPGMGSGPRAGMGPGGGGARAGGRGPAAGLLSPEEMTAQRNTMRSTKTIEECKAVQAEHRTLMESRAKEKGITLPTPRANACERMFAQGANAGPGRGAAPGWNLLTPEEREAQRTQMRSVKTYDECKTLQTEHRALMESRAKAQGVTLPTPRQQMCDRMKARGLID